MEISGYIVLLCAVVLSRYLTETSFRALDDQDKLRLMNGFSRSRAFGLVPILIIIGLYFYLIRNSEFDRDLITVAYFATLALYVLVRLVMNQRKLTALAMPPAYRRGFLFAQLISFIGVAWCFFAISSSRYFQSEML